MMYLDKNIVDKVNKMGMDELKEYVVRNWWEASEKEYRRVEGFSNYVISKCGTSLVNTLTRSEIATVLSGIPQYKYVNMYNDEGERKLVRLHRLVAVAWVDNPNNEKYVDHIDRDEMNNHADNLRWCDRKTNGRNTVRTKHTHGGNVLIDEIDRLFIDAPYGVYKRCHNKGYTILEAFVREFGYLKYGMKDGCLDRVVNIDGKDIYLIQYLNGDKDKYKVVCKRLNNGWSLHRAIGDN